MINNRKDVDIMNIFDPSSLRWQTSDIRDYCDIANIEYFIWNRDADGDYQIISDCDISDDGRDIHLNNIIVDRDGGEGYTNILKACDLFSDKWKIGISFVDKTTFSKIDIDDYLDDFKYPDSCCDLIHLDMSKVEIMPWCNLDDPECSDIILRPNNDFTFTIYWAYDVDCSDDDNRQFNITWRALKFNHNTGEITLIEKDSVEGLSKDEFVQFMDKKDQNPDNWIANR